MDDAAVVKSLSLTELKQGAARARTRSDIGGRTGGKGSYITSELSGGIKEPYLGQVGLWVVSVT